MAAKYTFHWTFAADGQTYHIYGAKKLRRNHPFGEGKPQTDPNRAGADPYYRINLLDLGFKDHGNYSTDGFKADKIGYKAQAQAAKDSGKKVIVVNCQSGIMRTTLMAIAIYMLFLKCDVNTAVNVYMGVEDGKDPGDSLKTKINFSEERAELAREVFS